MDKLNTDKKLRPPTKLADSGLFLAKFQWLGKFYTFLYHKKMLPTLLKAVYITWMRFVFILGWVNTRLILVIIFYLLFTPLGLIMRLFGKDLLEREINKQKESYWKKKEPNTPDYQRQF